MESFFLAETTKYLYLLFDPDNFIHNNGSTGTVIQTPNGECVIDAGGYFFNTEAHPIDVASVYCCSAQKKEDDKVLQKMHDNLDLLALLDIVEPVDTVRGTKWKTLKEELERQKKEEERKKKEKEAKHLDNNVDNKKESNSEDIKQVSQNSVKLQSKESPQSADKTVIDNKDSSTSTSEDLSTEGNNNQNDDNDSKKDHTKNEEELVSMIIQNVTQRDASDTEKENVKNSNKVNKVQLQNIENTQATTNQPVNLKSQRVDSTNINIKHTDTKTKVKTKNTIRSATANLEKIFTFLLDKFGNTDVKERSPDVFNLYHLMQYYPLSYHLKPELMTCPAQPFHMRVSVNGEMFEDET